MALTRAGDLSEGELTLTPEELQRLVVDVSKAGDASRGEQVYRRQGLSCVGCHAIGGAGGMVGPDLTSIGASAPVDYLIESIWFPNRKIKEGYHSILLETKDGQEVSGVLVREGDAEVVVRTASNQELAVPKQNIQERRAAGSLMPAGLIDYLAPQERLDLFKFLSELGKPGRFDASRGNVARYWKARPGIHTLEQFGEAEFVSSDLKQKEWVPLTSLVDGRVHFDDLQNIWREKWWASVPGVYVATRLQVPEDGRVEFKLEGAKTAAVWLDGKVVAPGEAIAVVLPAGMHQLVVRLDSRQLPETFRVESSGGTFLVNF